MNNLRDFLIEILNKLNGSVSNMDTITDIVRKIKTGITGVVESLNVLDERVSELEQGGSGGLTIATCTGVFTNTRTVDNDKFCSVVCDNDTTDKQTAPDVITITYDDSSTGFFDPNFNKGTLYLQKTYVNGYSNQVYYNAEINMTSGIASSTKSFTFSLRLLWMPNVGILGGNAQQITL